MPSPAGRAALLLAAATAVSASVIPPSDFVRKSEFVHPFDAVLRRDAASSSSASAPSLQLAVDVSTEASALSGKTYDYVIVGGGTAALAVAARLAASDNSTTVAVIEAGSDGSEVIDRILPPANAYYNGIANAGSAYDWSYYTSNQTDLENREIFWPRGKLLGGSSAVNGVYMTRGSASEHNAWSILANSSTWNFTNVLPYYIKHETFEAPSAYYSEDVGGITVDTANHGYSGPIHYSRAPYLFPQIDNWIPTFANLGVGTVDPASGDTAGAYISTSAIRGSDATRSYAAVGYLETIAQPSNLHILTGYQVTKINFSSASSNGSISAKGVSYQASADASSYSVYADKEVILSAGVIGSPALLQLSGVGPAALLEGLGIDVVLDLPGVGQHLQDHLSTSVTYSTTAAVTGDLLQSNATYNASQYALWTAGHGNQSLYSAPNEAIAYVNLTTLFNGTAAADKYITALKANMTAQVKAYNASATVAAGYEAAYSAEIEYLLQAGDGAAELLMANTGYDSGAAGKTTTLQFALQHPFSRGAVEITSTDPFTIPSIDPGYFTHPGDILVMRQAMKYIRQVAQTAPLAGILGDELAPGLSEVASDAEIDAYLRSSSSTEYHPAGSCSQLPLAYGGVVDDQLRVHGLANVRVIDSSVIPVGFAAHLTSPTYAIAEKGAAIILGTDASAASASSASSASSGSLSSGSSSSGGSSDSSVASTTDAAKSAAASLAAPSAGIALLLVAATFAFLL